MSQEDGQLEGQELIAWVPANPVVISYVKYVCYVKIKGNKCLP